MDRAQMLKSAEARKEPWDIVVIGGGATGVGCALDAASRGLAVLLLEQADFGKGTSGRSTKLIHGGVRYLAQGNIPLVREGLSERGTLLKMAPDFIKQQRFLVPCYSRARKLFYLAGLKVYDLLAGESRMGRTRSLGAAETETLAPGLKKAGLKGAVEYFDARFDDARFLIALASKAADEGAVLINYAKAVGIESANSELAKVKFRDEENGSEYEAEARSVIQAAGIFSGELDGEGRKTTSEIAFSQGIHIVLDGDLLGGDSAIMIPKTPDGRLLFAIPWHGKLLVGTTDTPVTEASLEPVALASEIDFVLDTCAGYLARKPARSDIRSVFAGIRPLVSSGKDVATAALSREHRVELTENAIVRVTGGKWTTFRLMAEEAVDAALSAAGIGNNACNTQGLKVEDKRVSFRESTREKNAEMSERLSPLFDYLLADVVFAVREEMARTIDDVLSRRTRILYTDATEALRLAPKIADVLARELGWDEQKKEKELRAFRELAAAYTVSP